VVNIPYTLVYHCRRRSRVISVLVRERPRVSRTPMVRQKGEKEKKKKVFSVPILFKWNAHTPIGFITMVMRTRICIPPSTIEECLNISCRDRYICVCACVCNYYIYKYKYLYTRRSVYIILLLCSRGARLQAAVLCRPAKIQYPKLEF